MGGRSVPGGKKTSDRGIPCFCCTSGTSDRSRGLGSDELYDPQFPAGRAGRRLLPLRILGRHDDGRLHATPDRGRSRTCDGFTFFVFGYVGGGDAKLFTCIALWFGLHDLANFALFASVFGGVLTLGLLSFRRLPLPATLTNHGWVMRLHDEKAGIPYGAALAAGAFAILPYTDVFHLGITA